KSINGRPADEVLRGTAAAPRPLDDMWVKQVGMLPPAKQVEVVIDELANRNPGYRGWSSRNTHPEVDNNNVISLNIPTDEVTDISPVGALRGLRKLTCTGTAPGKGKLADLSPLKGLPLALLNCEANPIVDLTPLSGMPLHRLSLNNTNVTDL